MKRVLFLILFLSAVVSAAPCFSGILINGGLSQEYTVHPGGKVEGKITVRNTSPTPLQVKIYQTDYLFFASGETVYGAPGSAPRSNAKWISFSPAQLSIPPQESSTVYYAIQVPDKQDLNGSYWSIVMVEPIEEIGPAPNQADKDRLLIQTIIRYGVQIVTDVGASAERRIRFLDKKLFYEDGRKTLEIDIENTGESRLLPFVWAEVYGKDGMSAGRFELGRARIFPGCSVRQSADLTKVPPGEYRVLVVVDNEDGYAVGAQYDLRVE